MPRRHKSDYQTGLEVMLNNPDANFLKNPKVFNEIHRESQMPISAMVRHLGKTAKNHRKEPQKPSDQERSEARLSAMAKD
jgi:hypothetical protein